LFIESPAHLQQHKRSCLANKLRASSKSWFYETATEWQYNAASGDRIGQWGGFSRTDEFDRRSLRLLQSITGYQILLEWRRLLRMMFSPILPAMLLCYVKKSILNVCQHI